jgi:XRE family transcriptional regulator, regulator of sulfur utilization
VAFAPKHRRVVGEAVRAYRKRAGLSQEELAKRAELHPNYIGEIERGKYSISLDPLLRIAKALGVRVRDLVADI